MQAVRLVFGDRVITRGVWPPQSPDLTPPDFYLWGELKGEVHANNPHTIGQLKGNIRAAIWNMQRGSWCECLLTCGGVLNFALKLTVDIFSY